MKTNFIIALTVLICSLTYGQKNEIKDLEKALKSSDYVAAKTAAMSADALVSNMDDKTKAKYYFLKSQAFFANGISKDADVKIALESLNDLSKLQQASGYTKYEADAKGVKNEIFKNLLSRASKAYDAKEYKSATTKFNELYRLTPMDTVYLYFAASSAVQASDYERSLEYYLELKDLGYIGSVMEYYATNKETGEEELFSDKTLRDASVTAGQYANPRSDKTPSRRAEIVKNIALIYVSNNESDKAMAAMKEAREENPEDLGLIIAEANLHLKMGNKDKFRVLMEEALDRDPNNSELLFNLGALSAEANDTENARKYYNKAIEINPNYTDALLNIAVLILEGESKIIEEMNGLGTSAADNKRYDELRENRSKLYAEAVPFLQKVIDINPKNIDATRTLMNMYNVLGETDKFKELKAKVQELEAGN